MQLWLILWIFIENLLHFHITKNLFPKKEPFVIIFSTHVFKGLPVQEISNRINFTIITTIFDFYNILYYPDYISIFYSILIIMGLVYKRDDANEFM